MSQFIPKPYKKSPTTIRIEYDKLELIDNLSNKFGMSRSEFINHCIDFAIDNMPTDKQ